MNHVPATTRTERGTVELAFADRPAASLLAAVWDHALSRPSALAVQAPDGEADYAALLTRAVTLAEVLKDHGVVHGDRVAVALAPGREAVASALAAFLLGASNAPIDPDQPPARIRQLIEGCAPSAVIGADGIDPASEAGPWPTLGSPLSARPGWAAQPSGDDVAYVIHTSGSTGVPKAIQVEHHNILNLLAEIDRCAPISPGSAGSWWASPGFDAAMWECWAPLTTGGTVAVVPAGRRLEADRFVAFLHDRDVAGAFVPPSFLPTLADTLERDPNCCADLERLLVGVEPIPLGLLQRIVRSRPGLTVLNGYGPAETTVCCTLYVVPPTGGSPHDRTPIGTPVRGNRAYLLDASGERTSESTGELVIAGAGVARGPLRPADSASGSGFLEADDGSGERAYRTGDLVRIRDDGEFVYIGRADRQVKLRGHRVEPAEVETVIRSVVAVREVVVGPRDVAGIGHALAAYLVPEDGADRDPERIRARVAQLLPYYAVPSLVFVLDEIPQTRHGKVDHERLAGLDAARAVSERSLESQTADVADAVEALVYRVWQAELPTSTARDLSFIEAGGASLSAARVASVLRTESGRDLSAHDVLRAASVADLAEIVRRSPLSSPADHRGRTRVALGVREQAMWFHDRLHDGQDVYLESLCYRLPADVDAERLARAVRLAAAAHPAFGASIRERLDGPALLLGTHQVELELLPDIDAAPGQESEAVGALISGTIHARRGPLCRCLLTECADGTSLLVLLWHHLVVDSWSARLFLRDLHGYYDDPAYQAPSAEATICDLIADRERLTASPDARKALAAAVATFTPVVAAIPGRPLDARGDTSGAVDITIDEPWVARIDQAARRRGMTTAAALMSAYERALCDVFDVDALPIAVAVDDRWLPGSEQVAGCLVDTVLHLGTRSGDNAAAFAAAMRPGARLPLPLLVSGLRAATGRPLFDFPTCYFGLDDECDLVLDGRAFPPLDIRRSSGRFGVTLLLRRSRGRIEGRLHHRHWALSPERAERLIERYLGALAEPESDRTSI